MAELLKPLFITLLDGNGNPVSGGYIKPTLTGTTTPATVYADAGLTTPAPIGDSGFPQADSAGRLRAIYLDPTVTYRIRVFNADGTMVDRGDIDPANDTTLGRLVTSDGAGLVGLSQSATYPTGSVGAHLQNFVCILDAPYSAKGDGSTDDTAAFLAALAALPSGGTLWLGNGHSFKLSQSLVLEKPVSIIGGAMEENKLLFTASGSYQDIGNGTKAGVIVMHSLTVLSGHSGDARRSSIRGLTLAPATTSPANMRGIVVCAPAYLEQVWATGFSLDGFAVMAAQNASSPTQGIANGTSFTDCNAELNGGNGFYFLGDDANRCRVAGCLASENTGAGFYDDSLLGNTFEDCEAQLNTGAGYYSNPAKPISGLYDSCYSDTAPHFSVGPKCGIFAPKGIYKPNRAAGGFGLSGLPALATYSTQPLRVASTDDIAQALGDTAAPGAAFQFGDTGIRGRFAGGEGLTGWVDDETTGYYTLLFNGNAVYRVAKTAIAGTNLDPTRGWFVQGCMFGGSGKSGIVGSGGAAPTTGTYKQGAILLHDAPAASGNIGWVCVADGTPGTWKTFGSIAA